MNYQIKFYFGLVLLFSIQACIGDDFIDDRVPAQLRITNPIDSLKVGDTHQIAYRFTNIIGAEETAHIEYKSSNENQASVSNTGLISGLAEGDLTIIIATDSKDGRLLASLPINVGAVTVASTGSRSGTLATTSSYQLSGGFTLSEDASNLKLSFDSNWKTTDVLPGLYVYLSNNKNSNAHALEISEVTVFEGAHEYIVPAEAGINDYSHVLFYCKPYGIKVGDGAFNN